jgi:hypothetical protein
MALELFIKSEELATLASAILGDSVSEAQLQRAKVEDVLAIKSDTGAVHYRAVGKEDSALESSNGRARRYVASGQKPDRSGDVIVQAGWDFEEFKSNPIALFCHDDWGFPIGKVSDWEITNKGGSPVLLETITYAEEDANPKAELAIKLVDAGILRGVSVGFLPVRVSIPRTEEERTTMGLGRWGVRYEKQKQLELSNCSIPCHPDALLLEKSAGTDEETIAHRIRTIAKTGDADPAVAEQLISDLLDRSKRRALRFFPSAAIDPAKEEPKAETKSAPPADAPKVEEPAPASDVRAEVAELKSLVLELRAKCDAILDASKKQHDELRAELAQVKSSGGGSKPRAAAEGEASDVASFCAEMFKRADELGLAVKS